MKTEIEQSTEIEFDYDEFMKWCCAAYSKATDVPARCNGYVWATNGHIVIRLDEEKLPNALPEELGEREAMYRGVLDLMPADGFTEPPSPVYDDSNVEECLCCRGVNEPIGTEDVNGLGDCINCGGVGRLLVGSTEVIDGVRISARYSKLIRMLPKLKVRRGAEMTRSKKPSPMLFFTFDGGIGALCGVIKREGKSNG